MEQLDLRDLLNKSNAICDALTSANIGNARTASPRLSVQLKNELALFGAGLARADGVVADDEREFIRTTLGFSLESPIIKGMSKKAYVPTPVPDEVPSVLKYAVVSDAAGKLQPDPFNRQASMVIYDLFKVFGTSILALRTHDVTDADVAYLTGYLEHMEKMLREYAVWRP